MHTMVPHSSYNLNRSGAGRVSVLTFARHYLRTNETQNTDVIIHARQHISCLHQGPIAPPQISQDLNPRILIHNAPQIPTPSSTAQISAPFVLEPQYPSPHEALCQWLIVLLIVFLCLPLTCIYPAKVSLTSAPLSYGMTRWSA